MSQAPRELGTTNKVFKRVPHGDRPQKCVTRVDQGQMISLFPFPLVPASRGQPGLSLRAVACD